MAQLAAAEAAIAQALKDPSKVALMECIGVKVYEDPQPPGHPPSKEQCLDIIRSTGGDPSIYSPLQP